MSDETKQPKDAGSWAKPVERLTASPTTPGAINQNVEGRRLAGPLQGFGQMWQKTYKVRLEGCDLTPAQVIAEWKANYGKFWPKGNTFYAPISGIAPGEVGLINAKQGPMRLSTGVMVLYADDESFTYMTPEGHPFAGWITFSSHEEQGAPVAQVKLLIRPSDPIYESSFRIYATKVEDRMWQHTLRELAAHLGASGEVETEIVLVDKKRQWRSFGNIWKNSIVRTTARAPFRAAAKPFRRSTD